MSVCVCLSVSEYPWLNREVFVTEMSLLYVYLSEIITFLEPSFPFFLPLSPANNQERTFKKSIGDA